MDAGDDDKILWFFTPRVGPYGQLFCCRKCVNLLADLIEALTPAWASVFFLFLDFNVFLAARALDDPRPTVEQHHFKKHTFSLEAGTVTNTRTF